jgi:hypothetical protein
MGIQDASVRVLLAGSPCDLLLVTLESGFSIKTLLWHIILLESHMSGAETDGIQGSRSHFHPV